MQPSLTVTLVPYTIGPVLCIEINEPKEIDVHNCKALFEVLAETIEQHGIPGEYPHLLLSCLAVTFIDSHFMSLLLQLKRYLSADQKIFLVSNSKSFRQVITICSRGLPVTLYTAEEAQTEFGTKS